MEKRITEKYAICEPSCAHFASIYCIGDLSRLRLACTFMQSCQIVAHTQAKKLIFLFLYKNMSQRYGSLEHPKHMLKQMGWKIFTILRSNKYI